MSSFLRCPKCFATPFRGVEPVSDVAVADLTCSSCGVTFASFRGVPYLCSFDHTDAHTVAEMLAIRRTIKTMQDTTAREEPGMVYQPLLDRWAGGPASDLSALKTRQIELILVQALLQGVPLEGAWTLDVGAGYGIDSVYYARRGARIVALEPGIGILAVAACTFRRFTWVGGTADAIPIASESMDVVTANASLHHHLKPLASLDEMLRVLKPGGWMITVSDSIKGAREVSLEEDYQHWDNYPTVLYGINEQILRLDLLLEKLASYGDDLAGEVYLREGVGEFSRFTLREAAEEVRRRPRLWAIMGMRVQKLRSFRTPDHRLREGRVSTSELVRTILENKDEIAGYKLLGALLSSDDVRNVTPLAEASRFLQLSGWRWPLAGKPEWRLIYKRGRLFARATATTQSVIAVFAIPAVNASQHGQVSLQVNGTVVHRAQVDRGQIHRWSLAIPALPAEVASSLVLEFDDAPEAQWAEHVPAADHIAVQRLEFSDEPADGCRTQGLLPRASTSALRAEGIMGDRVVVRVGNLVEPALHAIAQLRSQGVAVAVECTDALWPFYAEQLSNARASEGTPLFATGMTAAQAKDSGATWLLHEGWAIDLTRQDVFAAQLAAPQPENELKLQRELEKARRKLDETRGKLETLRAKSKLRSEAGKKRGFWDRVFRRGD